MIMPPYVSLKNRTNSEYRNNHASKMQKNYVSPQCCFKLVDQGNGSYGIKNEDNHKYLQCNITTMSDEIKGDCQKWQFLSIPTITNGFYIQNLYELELMTKKAGQLSKNAGSDEIYIVEERSN